MDKKFTKNEYKDALNLLSHLILTKPKIVRKFLANNGIEFSSTPKRHELTNELIDLLAERDPVVYKDFTTLISAHIKHKGAEMTHLSEYLDSYYDEDEFFGAVMAGLGIAKKIGGLFGRKKRRRAASRTSSVASTSQNNTASLMKAQMRQMQTQQRAADARRRADENRRRTQREQDDRRRKQREEDDRKRRQREEDNRRKNQNNQSKNNNQILMIGGAVAAVAVVGIILTQKKAA